MTHDQFCYWLLGMLDRKTHEVPTELEWMEIKSNLKMTMPHLKGTVANSLFKNS